MRCQGYFFKITLGTRLIQASEYFGVIMHKTSDISRKNYQLLCLSYIMNGEKREAFVGFSKAKSTTGEALYELLWDALKKLHFDVSKIAAEYFDGASNMSRERKSVVTRMKEISPISLYIHCYGHLIKLALKDTRKEVPVLRSILGR